MARWATEVVIAGVDFTGCRAEVLDGDGFVSNVAGSVDWGNDFSPSIQVFDREKKGIAFGLQFGTMAIDKLNDTIDAIQAAAALQTGFRVQVEEGLFSDERAIDVDAVVDYNQRWLTKGPHSEGYIEGVTLRFITLNEHA